MRRQVIYTKRHIVSFCEDIVEIRMKPITTKRIVLVVLAALFPSILFLMLSIFAFLKAGYFYAILFFVIVVLIISVVVINSVQTRRRETKFGFVFDEQGVKHIDVDAIYQMAWNDIMSWGYVDHNVISGQRTPHSLRQICLYFSKDLHEERFLRKSFNRIDNRRYGHCSTNKLIVFGFQEDNIEEILFKELNDYICKHCDKSKRVDYLNDDPDFCSLY